MWRPAFESIDRLDLAICNFHLHHLPSFCIYPFPGLLSLLIATFPSSSVSGFGFWSNSFPFAVSVTSCFYSAPNQVMVRQIATSSILTDGYQELRTEQLCSPFFQIASPGLTSPAYLTGSKLGRLALR